MKTSKLLRILGEILEILRNSSGVPLPFASGDSEWDPRLIAVQSGGYNSNAIVRLIGGQLWVNAEEIRLSGLREKVVLRMLATHALTNGGFLPTQTIIDRVERSVPEDRWKLPSDNDIARVIWAIRKRLHNPDLLQTSPETGGGYRLSVPAANIRIDGGKNGGQTR